MSLVTDFDKLLGLLNAEENELAMEFRQDLEEAQAELDWLGCLEDAGVDNWQGIDFAKELLRELEGDSE